MRPIWLDQFDRARAGRTRGFVLVGNTADKVFAPETELPAVPLKYFLAAYLAREGYRVGSFSLSSGFEELRPPAHIAPPPSGQHPFASLPNNAPPDQVLSGLTPALRDGRHRVAIILDYADHLAPALGGSATAGQMHMAVSELLHGWGLDENIRASKNLVLLVSYENQVSELLLQSGVGFQLITVPLPDAATRAAVLESRARAAEGDNRSEDRLSNEELARLMSGLPVTEIEALCDGESVSRSPRSEALGRIRERKSAVIHQMCQGLLEVHETDGGFNCVSGLNHAKDELSRVVRSFRTNPESAPQALLLAGVPGCGKSFIVKALAHELGFPCLAMRNVREGIVGSSERNLDRVLWVAETLAPCVIWLDEIDQVMGQRNTGQSMDAGVSERMMARIWEFMGGMRHRGKILWVGTSNRPDVLDSALLDRFQLVLPFLHPTKAEVVEMLPALAAQVGRVLAEDIDLAEVAALPSLKEPTVRALQEIVARAGALADDDQSQAGSVLGGKHLAEACADYVPSYNPMQHQLIALNAVRMATFASLLPWRVRGGRRVGYEIPSYLTDIVDDTTGALDVTRLHQRVAALLATLQAHQQQQRF